ncbi:MAG: HAMP domain-containing protein, partial [Planctomycetaceae bacterium]|nr:HAMP domain-containing protein [Planctomycetaceae bacterium]
TSMRTARNTISLGQSVLLSIAIAAILVAISVGHFYVGRTLLPRIEFLARAAGNISEGRSASRIPDDGSDELSDLARALNLFRDTRDELIQSAKLAALGQMAAGIGHELNQPLAAIRSQTHNAERYISRKEPEKALQNLNKIEQATARMSEQIGHLRRFARLPERTIGPVDPMIAIDEAIALLAHRFEDEQVCVFVDRGSRDV